MTDISQEFPGPISASVLRISEVIELAPAVRISGSLIPIVTGSPAHSLGSPETPWDEGYFGTGSIYVGGIKLVQLSDQGDLILNPQGTGRLALKGKISGNLEPYDAPGQTKFRLGNPNNPWAELYLGSSSLHVGGVRVLSNVSGVMQLGEGEDFQISGSLFGSLVGTASLADTAATASVAETASFTETASVAETAATATLAGFAQAAPTTVTVHSGIVDQMVLDLLNTVGEIPESLNTFRFLMDLSLLNQVRLVANVTLTDCGAGSFVGLQFSTDEETTWDYLGGGELPQLPCETDGSVKSGSWADITGSAKQEVVIRLVGKDPTQNGQKANTVEVGTFLLQFR